MSFTTEKILSFALRRLNSEECPYCHGSRNAEIKVLNDGSLVVHTHCCANGNVGAIVMLQASVASMEYLYKEPYLEDTFNTLNSTNQRLKEDIQSRDEQIQQRDDLIHEIEKECADLSVDIIDKVCKRVWRNVNELRSDEYDSYMDEVTIKYVFREYSISEINPYLEDHFLSEIEKECKKLTPIERHILEYSACSEELCVDIDKIYNTIYDYFLGMIEEHSNTKEMQNIYERM